LFPGDDKIYERALEIKEQISSKYKFCSEIKNRESDSNFKTKNDFNLRTEGGNTKKNFHSSRNLDNLGNISKITRSNLINITEPNINDKSINDNNYYFHVENNITNLGNNSANPTSYFTKSVFSPLNMNKNVNNNGKIDKLEAFRLNKFAHTKPYPISEKKLTQKEYDNLVQEYKSKLNAELLKILQEEKYKEEEREVLYHNTLDIVEKKRFEKIISMERAQSSERIVKMNE